MFFPFFPSSTRAVSNTPSFSGESSWYTPLPPACLIMDCTMRPSNLAEYEAYRFPSNFAMVSIPDFASVAMAESSLTTRAAIATTPSWPCSMKLLITDSEGPMPMSASPARTSCCGVWP